MAEDSPRQQAEINAERSKRASAALLRKGRKTALEDVLGSKNGIHTVTLVRFCQQQLVEYESDLHGWREKRSEWKQQSKDDFEARRKRREFEIEANTDDKPVFQVRNDSLNICATLSEFASAQAEMDLFGGDPWFAAKPVGMTDGDLADTLQKHRQWTLRDGVTVGRYAEGLKMASDLGEVFYKSSYRVETEDYEAPGHVLLHKGKRVDDGGRQVYGEAGNESALHERAKDAAKRLNLKAEDLSWSQAFVKKTLVLDQGVETRIIDHNDVAFNMAAPELDLRYTNVYVRTRMTAAEAMRRFGLSRVDAIRLALQAQNTDIPSEWSNLDEVPRPNQDAVSLGADYEQQLLNSYVKLMEGYVRADPVGDGRPRSMYLVFPDKDGEEWLIYSDYLANLSPKAHLPIHCHPWEKVPGRLFGRGFYEKYQSVQTYVDNLWNQVGFRNDMHANPMTGVDRSQLQPTEDGEDGELDLKVQPGVGHSLKNDGDMRKLFQFAEMPDLDDRSMDLLNMAIQMAQLRSGITSASQGDMSALPENNTATGVRQLMSRAAVLLKKPVRCLRRSFARQFGYETKLLYVNFDRVEFFLWGEGDARKPLRLDGEKVANLDLDVQMLLTQEQNQTKLEAAQVAMGLIQFYLGLPEVDKAGPREFVLQAMKALEYDKAESMVREPAVTLADIIALLPEEAQAAAQQFLADWEAQKAAPPESSPAPAPAPSAGQTQAAAA